MKYKIFYEIRTNNLNYGNTLLFSSSNYTEIKRKYRELKSYNKYGLIEIKRKRVYFTED